MSRRALFVWFLPVSLSGIAIVGLASGATNPAATPEKPAAKGAKTPSPEPGKRVRAKRETTIYWSPAAVRPRRAIVHEGSVVALDEGQGKAGAGCRKEWLPVAGGGFLCSDAVEPTDDPVRPVAVLVDDLLPFVYVHRLETKAFSYAYLPENGADKARLFRRGKLFDESRYQLHTPSRFKGRNLARHPIKDRSLVPGWVVAAAAPVFAKPTNEAAVSARLALHTPLLVGRESAARGWRKVRDAEGKRALGYMREDGKLRYWVTAEPVEGLSKGETWMDIDVGQQMIALRTFGTGPTYVTLISSGLVERPSPLGVYRLEHKLAYRSMGNLPWSADKYYVENVPWTMYFKPNFAIHGAYWHNEFGNRRSHGCVNLAPYDARFIYQKMPPLSQPGFFKTFASDQAPGAVVRLRDSERSRISREEEARTDSRS